MSEVLKRGQGSKKRKTSRLWGGPRHAPDMVLIKQRIEQFVKRQGRRPRILVGSLGEKSHDQMNKLIASIFAESGFDVDIGPPYQTPQTTARMAVENDVHIVCFLIQDNSNMELIAEFAKALQSEDGRDIRIVLGGVITEPGFNALYGSGVDLIFQCGPVDTDLIHRVLDLFE
jgi:methylmalonyl-CoA mutase